MSNDESLNQKLMMYFYRSRSSGKKTKGSREWSIKPFNDDVEVGQLRAEWEEWLDSFEFEANSKGLFSQAELFNLLMTKGGRAIQRIHKNKVPVKDEITEIKAPRLEIPEYDNAVARLNDYFVGKTNKRVERTSFREMNQLRDEPFNKFMVRLQVQAGRCRFGTSEEEEIIDQIVRGARSQKVRDKGVDEDIKLDKLSQYAIKQEKLVEQKESLKRPSEGAEELQVSKVDGGFLSKRSRQNEPCTRCGSEEHDSNSQNCRARFAKCFACQNRGHLANFCKSKKKDYGARQNFGGKRFQPGQRPGFGGQRGYQNKKFFPKNEWTQKAVQNVETNDEWGIELPCPKKVTEE